MSQASRLAGQSTHSVAGQSVHSMAAVQTALDQLTGFLSCVERLLTGSFPVAVPIPAHGILMLLTRILSLDDSARQAGRVPAKLSWNDVCVSIHPCPNPVRVAWQAKDPILLCIASLHSSWLLSRQLPALRLGSCCLLALPGTLQLWPSCCCLLIVLAMHCRASSAFSICLFGVAGCFPSSAHLCPSPAANSTWGRAGHFVASPCPHSQTCGPSASPGCSPRGS